jgi:SWI/SNF-related matrix-associated actin-dependent regulator 1 of chromatin subfamily A
MSYENAPATRLLATHCAVCSRSLVDAVSVETGIGPICASRYGAPSVEQTEANRLVYQIAAVQKGPEVLQALARLRVLGFTTLADRIAARLGAGADLVFTDGTFSLRFRRRPDLLEALKAAIDSAHGRRRWDGAAGAWALDAVAARVAVAFLTAQGWGVNASDEAEAALDAAPVTAAVAAVAAPRLEGRFEVHGQDVAIFTPYHVQAPGAIKAAAAGRARWDGGAKAWTVPLARAAAVAAALAPIFPALAAALAAEPAVVAAGNAGVAQAAQIAQVAQGAAARAALAGAAAPEAAGAQAQTVVADVQARLDAVIPAGLALLPYQTAGVAFIEAAVGRALVADEMGLGKTVQALAWIAIHAEVTRVLIVVPASLTHNWAREAAKWVPGRQVYRVRNGKDVIPADAQIVIVGYEQATRRKADLIAWAPQAVILDEAHYLKNAKSQRARAVVGVEARKGNAGEAGIATGAAHVLALTGTPILNRPVEAWTILRLVRPEKFSNFFAYVKRFCDAHQIDAGRAGLVWDFSGASNLGELHDRLRDAMVRRLKADVLTELPAKRRAEVVVEIDNRADYVRAERDSVVYLRALAEIVGTPEEKAAVRDAREAAEALGGDTVESVFSEALVKLNALRRLVGQGKVAAAIEWTQNFLESGRSLVIFAHHKDVLDALEFALSDVVTVRVDGDVSADARQAAVDAFEAGEARVFLGTYGAAGVGLTLTAASDTLHVEREWTPATEEQAEDRVHRIGQVNACTAWYLVAPASVDGDFHTLVEAKRGVIKATIDGGAAQTGGSLFKALAGALVGRAAQ